MSEFLNNILDPPKKIEVGQIWWSEEIKEELVITDDKLHDEDVFRAALVSRVIELDNGIDLLITTDKYTVYSTPRRVISKTDGPVHRTQLTFFRGKLNSEDVKKLMESLKSKPKLEYSDVQRRVLAEMLEKLHPLRLKSFDLYEESIPGESSNRLTLINMLDHETEPFTYSLAAADENVLDKTDEFWTAEWENRENSIEVYNENDIAIRLNMVNGHLYFIIYAGDIETKIIISDISIVSDEIIIKSIENELQLGPNARAFTGFDEQSIKSGNYKLYFLINGAQVSTNIIIE